MATYTYAQLEALWIRAGGSAASAPVAAAVAMAESSGRSDATSHNPDGGTNVGFWQLDTPGGVGAGHTVAQLKDPVLNAQIAVKGSKGGSAWGQWSTFVGGAYKRFLKPGVAPDSGTLGTEADPGASTVGLGSAVDMSVRVRALALETVVAFLGVGLIGAGVIAAFPRQAAAGASTAAKVAKTAAKVASL